MSHEYSFQRPPLTIQERAAFIKVIVSVYCQDDTKERPVIVDKQTGKSQRLPLPCLTACPKPLPYYAVEIEGSTRLSAVRWTVSGKLREPELARSARQTGQLFLPPENKPCELHSSVSELAGTRKEFSLLLVFRV